MMIMLHYWVTSMPSDVATTLLLLQISSSEFISQFSSGLIILKCFFFSANNIEILVSNQVIIIASINGNQCSMFLISLINNNSVHKSLFKVPAMFLIGSVVIWHSPSNVHQMWIWPVAEICAVVQSGC